MATARPDRRRSIRPGGKAVLTLRKGNCRTDAETYWYKRSSYPRRPDAPDHPPPEEAPVATAGHGQDHPGGPRVRPPHARRAARIRSRGPGALLLHVRLRLHGDGVDLGRLPSLRDRAGLVGRATRIGGPVRVERTVTKRARGIEPPSLAWEANVLA